MVTLSFIIDLIGGIISGVATTYIIRLIDKKIQK